LGRGEGKDPPFRHLQAVQGLPQAHLYPRLLQHGPKGPLRPLHVKGGILADTAVEVAKKAALQKTLPVLGQVQGGQPALGEDAAHSLTGLQEDDPKPLLGPRHRRRHPLGRGPVDQEVVLGQARGYKEDQKGKERQTFQD